MPNIDDILQTAANEFSSEAEAPATEKHEIFIKRPWQELDFEIDHREKTPPKSSRKQPANTPAEIWYHSLVGIWLTLRRHAKKMFASFVGLLAISLGLASFLPSTYFATLHLYAPEKTDSIASRLQLFSNKIEFASFPVDFKIPLGLIARRLKSDAAKAAVIEKFSTLYPQEKNKLVVDLVGAETFYAEGSELLVIQGYANSPEFSVRITNLYWEYLESQIKTLRQNNLEKVHHWIQLTSHDWKERLNVISADITNLPAASYLERTDQLGTSLVANDSDAQLKRRMVLKEINSLNEALSQTGTDYLWSLPDPEIQDIRRINEALQIQRGEATNLETSFSTKARELSRLRLHEKEIELAGLNDQISHIRSQLALRASASKVGASMSARQMDLLRQQSDYVGRIEDLEKLRDQVEVESTLVHTKLEPIQAAVPDESTRRPSMILKYSVATVAAFILALFSLVLFESRDRRRRKA